jgi:ABC-type transport system substrate-binding protein
MKIIIIIIKIIQNQYRILLYNIKIIADENNENYFLLDFIKLFENINVMNDNYIYVMKRCANYFLRNDKFWSDGPSVVAENFVYSARGALSSSSVCCDLFFPLKNAFAFFNDEIESFAPVGIKALDSKI